MPNNEILTFAGLWDAWTDKASGEVVESCTMLTRAAVGTLAAIYDRMPIALEDEAARAAWLDPRTAQPETALTRFVETFDIIPMQPEPREPRAPRAPQPTKTETPLPPQLKLF